jgi:DNA-binding Lrp family transcriptional regulator
MANVLKALSDQRTQKLFKAIIEAEDAQSQLLIVELGLSRRQYYNRIKDLVSSGLIRRQRGKYRLSSFGKVIYSLQKIAERTASNYWKLEAIDSIRMSDNSNLAEVDYMKIIDILLDDVEIKDIYLHGDIFDKNKPQEKDHKREVMLSAAK